MRVIRAEQLTRSGSDRNRELESHCIFTARCEIAGIVMEICTDMRAVASLFARRYADHQPAREGADFRYYVATVRGGYAFWCAHAPSWRWSQGALPPDAVAFLTDAVALAALVRFDARIASMHAAALEYNGVAAAIAGGDASPRAATLLASVRRGMRVYSDDRTILRENLVYPLLRRNSVRAAGARLLLAESDAPSVPESLRSSPELSLRTCFGKTAIAPPRPLRVLFVVAGEGHCAGLEAVDTAVALPAIARRFDARGDMVDRIARAISLLQGVRCYKLTLGTPDESAAAMVFALARVAGK